MPLGNQWRRLGHECCWYDTASPAILHPVFSGASPGTLATFTPSAGYSFYFTFGMSSVTRFSQASLNASGYTADHYFAIFQDPAAMTPAAPHPPASGQR